MPPDGRVKPFVRRARAGRPTSNDAGQARVRCGAGNAAALGHGLAGDLLDVRGESDGSRRADGHPDTVGMDGTFRGLELSDTRRVEASRNEYADVLESRPIKPGSHL